MPRPKRAHPSQDAIASALASQYPAKVVPIRPMRKQVDIHRDGFQQVTFVIDGKTISGNHYKMPDGRGGSYVTKEAKNFKQLVLLIAMDAVFRAKYEIPEYCRLDVTLCNSRQDRDNAVKVLNDSCQAVIYSTDSRILDGAIRKIKDDCGERTIVTATEVMGSWYGYPRARKNDQALSHETWVADMLTPFLTRERKEAA